MSVLEGLLRKDPGQRYLFVFILYIYTYIYVVLSLVEHQGTVEIRSNRCKCCSQSAFSVKTRSD